MVTTLIIYIIIESRLKNNLEALFCGGAKLDDKIQKKFNKFLR